MTKTNKAMGFVTIEDIQGNIELVLFPRTWEKNREQLSIGQIIIVEGKADTSSTPPKVLVDSIRTEIKVTEALDDALTATSTRPSPRNGSRFESLPRPATQLLNAHLLFLKLQRSRLLMRRKPLSNKSGSNRGIFPPPPDNFPDGWDEEWQPTLEHAEIAARDNQRLKK